QRRHAVRGRAGRMRIAEDVLVQQLRMFEHLRFRVKTSARVIEIDVLLIVETAVLARAQRVTGLRCGVVGILVEEFVVHVGHGCSIFSANPIGSVSVRRSAPCTQYCPASAWALIWGAVPGDAFTETPSLQPPPLVRGNPTPRPTAGPAVSVTTIVPADVTVNVRALAPPGAITLDQFSVTVVDALLGVVGVLSLPQPASIIAALNAMTEAGSREPEARFMGAKSESKSSLTPATRRHPRCSRSSQRQASVCRSVVRPAL